MATQISNQNKAGWGEILFFALGIYFVHAAGYELFNQYAFYLEQRGFSFFSLDTFVDDKIPFKPLFAYFYYSYYLLVLSVVVLAYYNRAVLYKVGTGYLAMSMISWISWAAFPVRMIRPDLTDCITNGCDLVRGMYSIDPGFNVLPSLHTGHTILVMAFFWKYNKIGFWVLSPLAVGVIASTVLIKQHFFLDLPPGVVVGLWGFYVGEQHGVSIGSRISSRVAAIWNRSTERS